MTEEKPIEQTHPSVAVELLDIQDWAEMGIERCANDYEKAIQTLKKDMLKIKKHTTDNQRIREALKKVLTSEYEGQVAVMPEYYKLLKELELEDE